MLALAGCSYRPRLSPSISPSQFEQKIEEGIKIYAERFDNKKECENVFQHNVNDRGYLPIFISLKNDTEKSELSFDRDNFRFFDSTGMEWPQAVGERMARSYEGAGAAKSTILAILFGAASGMFSAMHEQQVNLARVSDFEQKSIRAASSIFPGSVDSGFVYYVRPKIKESKGQEFEYLITNGKMDFEYYDSAGGRQTKTINFSEPTNWESRN